jgi:hypothetical protein
MRVIVSGLFLCMAALLTMGQINPQKAGNSMQRIEAREILLSDGTTNAKLAALVPPPRFNLICYSNFFLSEYQ